MSFANFTPMLKSIQEATMTDRCKITREGVVVLSDIKCRVTNSRLFTEPGDPQDANMRSTREWGWTLPIGTDVRVADEISKMDGSLACIIGEVISGDTWQVATRAWGTIPKTATPHVTITLVRLDEGGTDDWVEIGSYDVQVVWDRFAPKDTPLRYAPAAHAEYKGGWVIGNMDFPARIADRFMLDGRAGVITHVAALQPQRIEAKFELDISGVTI